MAFFFINLKRKWVKTNIKETKKSEKIENLISDVIKNSLLINSKNLFISILKPKDNEMNKFELENID